MAAQYKVIHPVKYYRDYLSNDIRPDGRKFDQYRPIVINIDSIETADGSAVVKIGRTTVVCGIKAELAKPKQSDSDSGYLIPNIELTPLCSSKYRPGAPTEEAQVYSKLLADILESSNAVDLKELCIAGNKLVWTLYCDIVCLDHSGCVLDASVIAIIAALRTLRLPTIIYDTDTNTYTVNEKMKKSLNIRSNPISTSFIVFDDNIIIVDPTNEEENLSTAKVTIAVSDGSLCLVHKPGGSSLSGEQFEKCMKLAVGREKSVITLLDSVINKSLD